uniref:Senescence domain-containing protein n=1 Tax=Kalanchoe fedtschenkoi TaxID=63787 RepID=A0A7N0TV26_KALFE
MSSFHSTDPNPPQFHSSSVPTTTSDLAEDLFQDSKHPDSPPSPNNSVEETLIHIPGAFLHLIDKQCSVELASGDFYITRLSQGRNTIAVLSRVGHDIQWPLTKNEAGVKLDHSHYFFSLRIPKHTSPDSSDDDTEKGASSQNNLYEDVLNYGLTFASKGQEGALKELDEVLERYCSFSVHRVVAKVDESEVLDGRMVKEMSPEDMKSEDKKELMEERCAAYWTTLAPNVEDYSGIAAKLIAAGSGQLIKGILWCGDVTVERIKWGNEVLKKRMAPGSNKEISHETLKRIKRVKKVTKMTEKVANGVLSGVIKVSGFFSSSVANSTVGKKFFGMLPGEIVLASLDGFSKVCDAVEVAGKNVMSTSSTVTTGLVSHRYGEEAAKATTESFDAAGHAAGAAWAVFKIRKAFNPKATMGPTTLAKSHAKALAEEIKAMKSSRK